ncbi:hypothetical protein [Paraburkholderia sp. PGU19]|uniref:hypothetical protein n=1 Tax=Paraburkholderia sp. PGU19 TaxID=2735434 RepID=UPI0015D9C3DA|nr:hypothetical protein [Paraburkholderia sp. PGU19]
MTTYQFLILLKPEANRPEVDRPRLLRLIYEHFERHHVEILDQGQFTGHPLRSRQALDFIYPRLSLIAQMGEQALNSGERDALAQAAPGTMRFSADQACTEFAKSASQLCVEGDSGRVIKLGPGAYAAHFVELRCVVLNHFFPEFRDRFYAEKAAITALECRATGLGLHRMRETLVGNICPSRAEAGSLRASALAHAAELGLKDVSVARNFFHISPGYIEATFQLAFLFPEGGSFQERMLRYGVALSEKQLEACRDRTRLAQLFAELEEMPLRGAIRGMKSFIDERPN